jgi:hypothetical protein
VTGLYWALVYNKTPIDLNELNIHAVNSLIVLVDLAVSRLPFYIKHM